MVGNDDLDLSAEHGPAGIFDRQTGRNNGPRPRKVSVYAALVVEHADLDGIW
jgi:hypothetical protein